MDTSELIHRLHLLQRRLYEMADDLGTLTDPEIIAVSEEADRLILQLQRLRMQQTAERRKPPPGSSGSTVPPSEPPEEIREQGGTFIVKHS